MSASWPVSMLSSKPAGSVWASLKARTRKLAIWALVTGSSGQNMSGSLVQPRVMRSRASCSMWPAHHRPARTSAKRDRLGRPGFLPSSRTRMSHTAISQRRMGSLGHRWPRRQPVRAMTRSLTSSSTASVWTPASSRSENSSAGSRGAPPPPPPPPVPPVPRLVPPTVSSLSMMVTVTDVVEPGARVAGSSPSATMRVSLGSSSSSSTVVRVPVPVLWFAATVMLASAV